MSASHAEEKRLGAYLRARRAKVDPLALDLPSHRRRTPGLRREEVAQRAHVSITWYTWLEQGRGGAPSADVLDRISRALMLTDAEREHVFWLGLGRPPEVKYQSPETISPRLQRVLEALEVSPAYVKTSTWDLIAWNRSAAAIFGYDDLPPGQRNILRRIFCDPRVREANHDWESVARFVVAAFRADATRAGAEKPMESLAADLCQISPEFEAMWRDQDVCNHGEGTKRLRHPKLGPLAFEYSAFAVDGRPDLSMVIYNPATAADAEKLRSYLKSLRTVKPKPSRGVPLQPSARSADSSASSGIRGIKRRTGKPSKVSARKSAG